MFTSDFSAGELQPELKQVFFHWRNASEDGKLPRLTQFELPNARPAPNILSVFEIERTQTGEPADFKALYIRNKIINTLSRKYVGTRLSEHPGFGPGSMIWSCFHEVASSSRPLLAALPYIGPLPEYRSTAEIYLPLLGEGVSVDYVLVGVVLLAEEYSRKAR